MSDFDFSCYRVAVEVDYLPGLRSFVYLSPGLDESTAEKSLSYLSERMPAQRIVIVREHSTV